MVNATTNETATVAMDTNTSIVVTATTIFILDFILISIALYVSIRIARKLRRQKRYCKYVLESISQESIDTKSGTATKATNTATATGASESRLVIPSQPSRPASPGRRISAEPRSLTADLPQEESLRAGPLPTSQHKEDTRVPISSPLRLSEPRSSFLSQLGTSHYEGEGRLVLHAGRTQPETEVLYSGDNWSYGCENSIQHIPRATESSTDSGLSSAGTLPRTPPRRVPLEISLYGTISKSASSLTGMPTASLSKSKETSLGRRSGVARYANRLRRAEEEGAGVAGSSALRGTGQERYIYATVASRATSPRHEYTAAAPSQAVYKRETTASRSANQYDHAAPAPSSAVCKRETTASRSANQYDHPPAGSTDTVRRAKPDQTKTAAPKLRRQENVLLPRDYKVTQTGNTTVMMC